MTSVLATTSLRLLADQREAVEFTDILAGIFNEIWLTRLLFQFFQGPPYVVRSTAGHFRLSNDGCTATVIGRSAVMSNNVICSSANLVNGVREYRLRQDLRLGSMYIGWAPDTFAVEGEYQYTQCGFFVSLSTGALYSQRGATKVRNKLTIPSGGRDSDIVTCRFDPTEGVISFQFSPQTKAQIAFRDVPCDCPFYPAMAFCFRLGDQFTLIV